MSKYINRPTQEERILDLFQSRGEVGVRSWEITGMGILQYNARIFGLRKKGHNIVSISKNNFVLKDGKYD